MLTYVSLDPIREAEAYAVAEDLPIHFEVLHNPESVRKRGVAHVVLDLDSLWHAGFNLAQLVERLGPSVIAAHSFGSARVFAVELEERGVAVFEKVDAAIRYAAAVAVADSLPSSSAAPARAASMSV